MAGWTGKIREAEDYCATYLGPLITAVMYRDELPAVMPDNGNTIYQLDFVGGGEPSDIRSGNYEQAGLTGGPDERFVGMEIKAFAETKDKGREFIEELWNALPMPEDQAQASWQLYLTDEPRIERGTIGVEGREGEYQTVWRITAPLTMQIHK